MKKIANNTLNIILVAAVIAMLVSGLLLMSGCKGGDIGVDEAAASEDDSDAGEVIEAEEADGDINGEEQDEDGGDAVEELTAEKETEEEEASQETTEEDEEVPVEITEEIKMADDYFNDGMYAEAAKEYRDAARMIEDADISQGLKDELLASINQNQPYKEEAENAIFIIGKTMMDHIIFSYTPYLSFIL